VQELLAKPQPGAHVQPLAQAQAHPQVQEQLSPSPPEPLLQQTASKKTSDEASRSHQHVPKRHPRFGSIDNNGDGFIDGIEFQNALARDLIG